MYQIGDRIVHPMHGAGVIQDIVTRRIDGQTEDYYALKLSLDDVVLLIPVRSCDEIGLRHICTQATALALLAGLPQLEPVPDECWNRRYRGNMLRIRSGDPWEVARVVKTLGQRYAAHGLSTGEKKMLASAEQILLSELALALGKDAEEIRERLHMRLCWQ